MCTQTPSFCLKCFVVLIHFHYIIATILLCALTFLLFFVVSCIDYINHLQYTSGFILVECIYCCVHAAFYCIREFSPRIQFLFQSFHFVDGQVGFLASLHLAYNYCCLLFNNKMYVEAKLLKSGKFSKESPKFLLVCSNWTYILLGRHSGFVRGVAVCNSGSVKLFCFYVFTVEECVEKG